MLMYVCVHTIIRARLVYQISIINEDTNIDKRTFMLPNHCTNHNQLTTYDEI